MALTKDQITQDALKILRAGGARVRKVHNVPFSRMKARGSGIEKGWPDIQGYSLKGLIILCEVKSNNDKLTQEQVDRLIDCAKCGGLAMVAWDMNSQTQCELFIDSYLYSKYLK